MRKKMLRFYLKVLLDTQMSLTPSQIGDKYYSTKMWLRLFAQGIWPGVGC